MPKLPTSLPLPNTDQPGLSGFVQAIQGMYERIAGVWNNPDFGTTAARPASGRTAGQFYFDTTLGKPVWWKASTSQWVDGAGTVV